VTRPSPPDPRPTDRFANTEGDWENTVTSKRLVIGMAVLALIVVALVVVFALVIRF